MGAMTRVMFPSALGSSWRDSRPPPSQDGSRAGAVGVRGRTMPGKGRRAHLRAESRQGVNPAKAHEHPQLPLLPGSARVSPPSGTPEAAGHVDGLLDWAQSGESDGHPTVASFLRWLARRRWWMEVLV